MASSKKEFSKIYDRYIQKIYRFIYLKVGSKETAQDLTAEVFTRSWRFYQKYGSQTIKNHSAFLFKSARNILAEYYRKRGQANILSIEELKEVSDTGQNFDKENALIDLERLKKLILQLSDDEQTALLLYYLDNLPVSEIADIIEKSENTTRVIIHRALKKLREKVRSS